MTFSVLRGLYAPNIEQIESFQNGVPLFNSKEEALEWEKFHSSFGSNPEYPHMKHIFTHLIGWEQMEEYIFPQLQSELILGSYKEDLENLSKLKIVDELAPVVNIVETRLNLPIHSTMNMATTMNTLKYCYNHMRSGILIVIKDNIVSLFAPFVNIEYRNNWIDNIQTESGTFEEYFKGKYLHYPSENVIKDKNRWWANGNIIHNQFEDPHGTHVPWCYDKSLVPMKHMFEIFCRERPIPDVEFFLNIQNYPQLKTNLTEPYDFLFNEKDIPLDESIRFEGYTPILGFYSSTSYADIPIPTAEDWQNAIGKVFPLSFIPNIDEYGIDVVQDLYLDENFEKFHVEWCDKVNTCFFRGSADGLGVSPECNQRLHICQLSKDWNDLSLLDAGITSYSSNDICMVGNNISYLKPNYIEPLKSTFIELYKQGKYKYLLYIESYCTPTHYSFLMKLGCVIFKVQNTREVSGLWFFPLLKSLEIDSPEVGDADHISIKADFSDLKEKIEWCRANDLICEEVAKNASKKYEKFLSKEPILDYMQYVLVRMAQKFERMPSWFEVPSTLNPRPKAKPSFRKCYKNENNSKNVYCLRCRTEIQQQQGIQHMKKRRFNRSK